MRRQKAMSPGQKAAHAAIRDAYARAARQDRSVPGSGDRLRMDVAAAIRGAVSRWEAQIGGAG